MWFNWQMRGRHRPCARVHYSVPGRDCPGQDAANLAAFVCCRAKMRTHSRKKRRSMTNAAERNRKAAIQSAAGVRQSRRRLGALEAPPTPPRACGGSSPLTGLEHENHSGSGQGWVCLDGPRHLALHSRAPRQRAPNNTKHSHPTPAPSSPRIATLHPEQTQHHLQPALSLTLSLSTPPK